MSPHIVWVWLSQSDFLEKIVITSSTIELYSFKDISHRITWISPFWFDIIAKVLSRKFIMSHSLLWRPIVLLTVGVYSSNHGVLHIIGIGVTRRFQKSVGPSICLSVRPSVYNANKKVYSIIDSRIIIHTLGERA